MQFEKARELIDVPDWRIGGIEYNEAGEVIAISSNKSDHTMGLYAKFSTDQLISIRVVSYQSGSFSNTIVFKEVGTPVSNKWRDWVDRTQAE